MSSNHTPQPNRSLAIWLVALFLLLSLAGCKKMADNPRRRPSLQHNLTPQQKQRAHSRIVLSTLSIARSRHKRATIYQQLGRNKRALQELNAILALPFPKQYRPGEEMRLDTLARKAKLLLHMKQPKQARQLIDHAIQNGSWLKHSFYLAHLYYVRGGILTSLNKPKRALKAFQTAIQLNQDIIQYTQKRLQPTSQPTPKKGTP
jgi:tetratricopeptide (TPR) repeat protein